MEEQEVNQFVETLRDRGLTCAKLKSMEKRERRDAQEFRKYGFDTGGKINEELANRIKQVKKQICKLK